MAWRWSGINWQGRRWTAAGSLRSLGEQVDREYPARPRTGDGTVASKGHDLGPPTNYNSDHHPQPRTGPGIVRGIDVSMTSADGDQATEALRQSRDPRIKYLIWNRRSFRPPTWEWKPYNLAPHDHHFHVSTVTALDGSVGPWQLTPPQGDEDVQSLRHQVAEAIQKGWLSWPDEGTFWLNLCDTPNDPQWRADFEPAWNQWKQDEWQKILATGGGIDEARVKALINDSQVVAPPD